MSSSPATGTRTDAAEMAQLRTLSDISRALTDATSLDQATRLIVERGVGLLDAKEAVLMLPDGSGTLQVRGTHGIAKGRVTRFSHGDADLAARLAGILDAPMSRIIAVPLVVGGAVSGVIAVKTGRALTHEDETLLAALADHAGTALENSRLAGEVRLQMEDRLRTSEAATDAKDRALSTLAHDIRTPLGAIEGYCALIEAELYGPVTEKQRKALERVRMSGRHLLSLLDNVMDMARINAGATTLSVTRVSLLEIARDGVDMVRPAAEATNQRVTLEGDCDVVVMGDAARMRQVLVNILSNAVKFTQSNGRIDVVCGADQSFGEVSVRDTGPGIGEAERSVIFEAYYRSPSAQHLPGVGLGLAISQSLMQQMGGDLLVRSEVGVGSTFTLRLPAIDASPSAA